MQHIKMTIYVIYSSMFAVPFYHSATLHAMYSVFFGSLFQQKKSILSLSLPLSLAFVFRGTDFFAFNSIFAPFFLSSNSRYLNARLLLIVVEVNNHNLSKLVLK